MRLPLIAVACLLAAAPGLATAQAPTTPPALTLSDALRLAVQVSPAVKLREAQLAAAEGARHQASTLLANNPELSLERSRTQTRLTPPPDDRSSAWAVALAQSVEIGGQQARRREAAAASLAALRAEIDDARRQARGDAALRFHAVLKAQRRIQIEQRSAALFDSTAQAVDKRRAAGEDTRLDANVARVEAERARNALAAAREQWLDARADLATALQLPAAALPDVAGDLAAGPVDTLPYSLEQLSASLPALPRLRALAAHEQAARARLATAHASRLPDLTLGLAVGREGPGAARERVTTLSVSMPLPLFQRNEAGIGQAISDVSTAEIERAGAVRDHDAQLRRLWSRLASQRERIQRTHAALLPASADNQLLAAKSRQAGQIGLLDQLLISRQALDTERELNDALADYHATRIELESAAGWPQEGSSR
ncbi:TolC family protein [Aquabacterium sp.]|uniref:TolC family protein n=1 Tax=Aquabacterium sp. TaxID=1872578 RepID=UPI002CF9662A|nr:TolC family protein [Aquabacterium sp.]HSW04579.1 TolC family protein [Aquabacterium sp.]